MKKSKKVKDWIVPKFLSKAHKRIVATSSNISEKNKIELMDDAIQNVVNIHLTWKCSEEAKANSKKDTNLSQISSTTNSSNLNAMENSSAKNKNTLTKEDGKSK